MDQQARSAESDSAESDAAPPVSFRTEQLISAKEVAALTSLSRKRIREAARAGHLTIYSPPAGVRGLVRYSKRSALALARSMVTPASSPQTQTQTPPEVAADDA